MNKEEILALPVGRELNMEVFTKVMGGKINTPPYVTVIPNFSEFIDIAHRVVETMAKDGWMLYKLAHTLSGKGNVDGYICIFLNIESGASREAIADTAPKAICKAALLTQVEL